LEASAVLVQENMVWVQFVLEQHMVRGATGDGIDIAVLDSGISISGGSTDINDIDTRIASFQSGADIIDSDNVPEDDDGHGSHVAGIIANEKNGTGLHGVAYEADLHIIRVLNDEGII
jgi:subtilisin family serine protease